MPSGLRRTLAEHFARQVETTRKSAACRAVRVGSRVRYIATWPSTTQQRANCCWIRPGAAVTEPAQTRPALG